MKAIVPMVIAASLLGGCMVVPVGRPAMYGPSVGYAAPPVVVVPARPYYYGGSGGGYYGGYRSRWH
jgi:hypothetical protein